MYTSFTVRMQGDSYILICYAV